MLFNKDAAPAFADPVATSLCIVVNNKSALWPYWSHGGDLQVGEIHTGKQHHMKDKLSWQAPLGDGPPAVFDHIW